MGESIYEDTLFRISATYRPREYECERTNGKTEKGYDYALYKKEEDGVFTNTVFLRISSEYIFEFLYSDLDDYSGNFDKFLNSISVSPYTAGERTDKMQTVEYQVKEVVGFRYSSQETMSDRLIVTFDVPEYFFPSGGADYTPAVDSYSLTYEDVEREALRMGRTFKVDKDYVIDDKIYRESDATGAPSFRPKMARADIIYGKSKSGLEYIVYENIDSSDFGDTVFVRITDEYIQEIVYFDSSENHVYFEKFLDSITCGGVF